MEQNNQKTKLMQVINEAPAVQLPAIPEIATRFKHLFSVIHPGAKAEVFYEAEKFHFMKLIQETKALQECSKLSLYGCFMDVAVSGLSFDPSFKHLYLVPFNTNVGSRDKPKWEKRAQLQISGYGELLLRQKQGQIKYADNPVLVYDGDEFSFGTRNGIGFVDHISKLPRKSDKIIACYLRIVRIDGSVDFKVITEDDMARFRKFSKDADKSKAWSDGIGGMWMAKCIKHAFRNYPKVRTGDFSELASATVDETAEAETVPEHPEMKVPDQINYDLGSNENGSAEEVNDDDFVGEGVQQSSSIHVDQDDF
ncbi:MAG: recombinase RecT [Flavisolibacter sp.]|jgi:phage RecT family recombinase